VALGVPGRDQHQRHGGDAGLTAERVHGLPDGRCGQLDEAARDRRVDLAGHPLDELPELFGTSLVGGAVAGDQQWGSGHVSGSPYSRALIAAAATADPPRALALDSWGRPAARSAAFDSAAPTYPTGSPTTSAGRLSPAA